MEITFLRIHSGFANIHDRIIAYKSPESESERREEAALLRLVGDRACSFYYCPLPEGWSIRPSAYNPWDGAIDLLNHKGACMEISYLREWDNKAKEWKDAVGIGYYDHGHFHALYEAPPVR